MKIVILLSLLFKDDLGPLNPVGPGAAAPPAPMVVTPLLGRVCKVNFTLLYFYFYFLQVYFTDPGTCKAAAAPYAGDQIILSLFY